MILYRMLQVLKCNSFVAYKSMCTKYKDTIDAVGYQSEPKYLTIGTHK